MRARRSLSSPGVARLHCRLCALTTISCRVARPIGRSNLRLADFIRADMENILVEWEAFAATQLPPGASMSALELRDHAEQILKAVAKDIAQPQTPDEEAAKSRGQAPQVPGAAETAAQTHALLRARS